MRVLYIGHGRLVVATHFEQTFSPIKWSVIIYYCTLEEFLCKCHPQLIYYI
jgi:hypothetical protein